MSVWTKFDPNGKPDDNWPPPGGLVLLRTPFSIELGYWRKPVDPSDPYVSDEQPEYGCWYDEHNYYNDAPQDWGGTAHWAPIPEFDA